MEPAHPLPNYSQARLIDGADPGRGFYPTFAVGDFNEDGRRDIVVLDGNQDGVDLGVSVYLQNTAGAFAKRDAHRLFTTYTTELLAADVTGDGHLDLVVNEAGTDLLMLTGRGNGTFDPPVYLGLAAPLFAVVADFDADGRLELAAGALDGTVKVFARDSLGAFSVTDTLNTRISHSPRIGQILVGDLNLDGKTDLVVQSARSPDRTGNLDVFLGNGDRTFKPVVTTANVGVWRGALGDFNGDGFPDFAGDRFSPAQVEVWLGRGDGTFTRGPAYPLSGNPAYIQTGDLNSDGIVDIVVATEGSSSFPAAPLSIFLGRGDGTFQPRQMLSPLPGFGVYNLGPRLIDFDGDGWMDIVAVAAHPTEGGPVVLDRNPGVKTDPGAGILINVQSAENHRTVLEWSPDFMQWLPLATNPAPAKVWPVVDPSGNQRMRFYRTRQAASGQ